MLFVGWACPPWFAPAVGALTVCYRNQGYLLLKAAVKKANFLNKNDSLKYADVQTDRAPYLPVETL